MTLLVPFVPSATSAATNERTQDGETVIIGSSPVDESGTAGEDVALFGDTEDVTDGGVDRAGVADGSVGDVISVAPGVDTSAGDPGEALLSGVGDNDMVADGDGDGSPEDDTVPDTASDTGEPGAGTDLCDADSVDTMTGGCPIDRAGPSITDVTVDVGADGEVLVRFRASDESGVSRVSSTLGWGGLLEGGGSYVFHPFSVHLETISIERASGDDLDGVWEQRLRSDIEPYPIRMVYVVWIDAVDGVGDRTFVSAPATAATIPTSVETPTSGETPTSVETPSSAEVLTGFGDGDDTIFDSPVSDVIDGWNGSDAIDPEVAGDTMTGPVQDGDLAAGVPEEVISTAFDQISPSITDVSMPAWIRAGETLTVTWRVADTNGVAYTYLSIGGAYGWITYWCGFAVNGELIDGNMFDGTYRLECELPSNAVNGTYTLVFSAFDSFSNVSPWDRSTQFDFEVTDSSNDINSLPISEVTSETTSDGEFVARCRVRELTPSGELGVCGLPAN